MVSPRSPLSPLSPEETIRDRLPPGDGESSGDEENATFRPVLPDDDGVSSDEESGQARDFYTLSKQIVERKRAQQKKRLMSQRAEPAAVKEAGDESVKTNEDGKSCIRRRRAKEKTNYLYSSFVPIFALKRLKELVSGSPNFEIRAPAAVLLIRVAGLTTLMHKINSELAGPERLCSELDRFYSTLTHGADAAGGDVVKILGDSVLFMFAVDGDEGPTSLGDATKAAARFARQAHDDVDALPAVEGVQLRLNSGIGCGTVSCLNLIPTGADGLSSTYAEFVITGSPLEQTRRAIAKANNDVVCSKVAWNFLRRTYEAIDNRGGDLVRLGEVLDVSDDPGPDEAEPSERIEDTSTANGSGDGDMPIKLSSKLSSPAPADCSEFPGDDTQASYTPRLRPALSGALAGVDLRKLTMFIPRTFDRALRFRYSYASYLEHAKISEVRDLTVCSVRIYGVDFVEPGFELCQEILSCVYTTVERMRGSTIKVQCDGQGMHMLLCFGMPGSVYEQSSLRALAAVYLLKDRLTAELGSGIRLWVGISTGWTFCGVVGSPLRMDYIVAGDAVDTARKLEEACGTPNVPPIENGNVVLMCSVTARHTKHEVNLEECREVCAKNLRVYVPLNWRTRHASFGVARNLGASQRLRNRQVAAIFETKSKETCVIAGGRIATAARAFADETVPILSRFHKMTLLRTHRAVSSYDDGALGLCTVCGAWRGPLAMALDVIESSLRRRPSFGVRMLRSPTRIIHGGDTTAVAHVHHAHAGLSDPTSPQPQQSAGSPWRSSTSFRMLFSSQGTPPPPSTGHNRSPPPPISSKRNQRFSTSLPNLDRGRSLGHLLSGKRCATMHEGDFACNNHISLVGRTSAVLAGLPQKLHKYASVLNDMFMPDERNPDLGDERNLANATLMMRRARLVQLVVMLVLQASKRARLALLLDNLDQMDDASWDVLYKLTRWQKKAANGSLAKRGKRRVKGMTSFMKVFSANGGAHPSDDADDVERKRRDSPEGIDMLQYLEELVSPHPFLVFAVAPHSGATGADRAEWLEIRRLSQEADAYIEMATLSADEARLYAAERLKLCTAESSEEMKAHAVKVVAECVPLDELIGAALGEPEVLASLLSEAKESGRVRVVRDGGHPPTLRVSPDLDAIDLPLTHAMARLQMVDELSVWRQHVLFAASIFKREFTARLLVEIALIGMDLSSVAAVCQDLCSPQESGRTLFHCSPGQSAATREAALDDWGAMDEASGSFVFSADDKPAKQPGLLEARRGEVFAFTEPLVQRALASRIAEPQLETIFRRFRVLAVTTDERERLYASLLPYVAKKYTRTLKPHAAESPAVGSPTPRTSHFSDTSGSGRASSFPDLAEVDRTARTARFARADSASRVVGASTRVSSHDPTQNQIRPASYVAAM